MDRRKALKQIGLLSGSVVLLSACDVSKENVSRVMNKLRITDAQEALMEKLIDTIIPETDIPGALSLKVADFVWVMADDCLNEDLQGSFLSGLEQFKSRFKAVIGSDFDEAGQPERVRGMSSILKDNPASEPNDDVVAFIEITKAFSILGFTKSEYFMTEVMPYTLIPGKNPQCKTIDPNQKINANA